jgi:hypothetical protein
MVRYVGRDPGPTNSPGRARRMFGDGMKIMMGVPTGSGQMCHQTVLSLLKIQAGLIADGHQVATMTVGQAEVSTARNVMAQKFLESENDLFLGIDDDMGAELALARKLIQSGVNFVGCYIPQRQLDLEAFAEAIRGGASVLQARRKVAPMVGPKSDKMGIFEVDRIGTGFYVVRRTVLQAMVTKGIAVKQSTRLPAFKGVTHGFFNNIVSEDGGILSEDYSFCDRVRAAGFAVHAYRGPGLTHTGLMTFV